MKSFIKYIKEVALGIWNLILGMKVTMDNFWRPAVTEQYPENRGTQVYADRFRALLVMPHDEKNEHKCTACKICEMNCPNGTIKISTKQEVDEVTGKAKKALDVYTYDLGTCIFCDLCVTTCPSDAIAWSNAFEHAVFERNTLVEQLNKPGSKMAIKVKPAAPAPESEAK
jgi:NADH-quinone oxidoreductase subunit I